MPLPRSWSAEAYNQVPESENRIHSDEVARAYGFRGALVPGVAVSACLLHPAAVAWGRDFAARGRAHVVVGSPVYDGETFRVEVDDASDDAYAARLVDPRGTVCAQAEVSLPTLAPEQPVRRHDPLLARDSSRSEASREGMEKLRASGLRALAARWEERAEITTYQRDPAAMAPVFHEEKLANPAFVLGLTNWLLAGNVHLSPWLHLETWSQHHRAIPTGTSLVAEARIADLFEKKGHEFVDVDVNVFAELDDAELDDAALATVRLRAIYLLRPPADAG